MDHERGARAVDRNNRDWTAVGTVEPGLDVPGLEIQSRKRRAVNVFTPGRSAFDDCPGEGVALKDLLGLTSSGVEQRKPDRMSRGAPLLDIDSLGRKADHRVRG